MLKLWTYILFGFLVAGTTSALAVNGFYPPQALAPFQQPRNLKNAWDSTVVVTGRFRCSGVLISNSGYVLTALHCLDETDCPALYEQPHPALQKVQRKNYMKTLKPRPGATCSGLSLPEFKATEAEVVYLGTGYIIDKPDKDVDSPDVREEALAYHNDFAILKFNLPHPSACLQIANSEPWQGEPVWNIGYPAPSFGRAPWDSDGESKYVSMGNIDGHDGDQLYTDADAYIGNSGGTSVNSSGELVGIVTRCVKELVDGVPDTVDQSASGILREVREKMGMLVADSIFDCPGATVTKP